jgi:DNA-binding MarR family transcriptional regulator
VPRRPLPDALAGDPGPTVDLANRLNSAAIHLLRRISLEDGDDGVTGARLSALSVLVYGGPQSLGSLARRERVSTPTMSRIVDALVRDGIVARVVDDDDRRSVRLTPTAEGRRLMERGRARRIERLARELSTLEPDEVNDLKRAVAALERLETREAP